MRIPHLVEREKAFQAEGLIRAKAHGFRRGHILEAGAWRIWRKMQEEEKSLENKGKLSF